jgi:hypothetical protein
MRQSPGYDPLDLRLRQVRAVASHPASDHVTREGPHPKRYRQSLSFRFLAEHGGHSVLHRFYRSQVLDHGTGYPIGG